MTSPNTVRRPGYAPDNASVGRRGRHTRERILACASDLFVADGYHGTSIEAVAKAVGGSRATVYQYFESKQEIFLELAHHLPAGRLQARGQPGSGRAGPRRPSRIASVARRMH